MFHFLSKQFLQTIKLPHLKSISSENQSLCQTTPLSASLISYLVNSCFLSEEEALLVAKKLRGKTPQDPDSIPTFLKNHGFSRTHISNLITKFPNILYARIDSNLQPKIEFFKQTGLTDSQIADFLTSNPFIFYTSLENKIKPVFDFIRSISGTHELISRAPRQSYSLFHRSFDRVILPNVTLLQNCSVSNSCISRLILADPRILTMNPVRFREIVGLIKEMGFDPSTHLFIKAVRTMGSLSRSTWEAKFETYRRLGWSDEGILILFRKCPNCIMISEEKIKKGLGFFMEELGWSPSFISSYPMLLLFSLEKRIAPRHNVLRVLKSVGVEKGLSPAKVFLMNEKEFLEEYVFSHCKTVPELLKFYSKEGESCKV